jgi:hypothetical protein
MPNDAWLLVRPFNSPYYSVFCVSLKTAICRKRGAVGVKFEELIALAARLFFPVAGFFYVNRYGMHL